MVASLASVEYKDMLMKRAFRWFGPNDPVTLRDIKQCDCEEVITSLHQIPYGELWSCDAIIERKTMINDMRLEWRIVESVPVSESIKTRSGDFMRHIENYKQTLRNLSAEGIHTVIYNFMPLLDWVRTDMAYKFWDGRESLYFDPIHFAAFEIYILKRQEAEKNYTSEQLKKAKIYFDKLSPEERRKLERSIIDVFPGVSMEFTIDDIRKMLSAYDSIDHNKLMEHLRLFLEEIIPVCEESGIRMAIHPDDPPYSILGLPRIVSCEDDIRKIINFIDSPSNGICFCTGSFSVRPDNDIPSMVKKLAHRINALHLRNTQINADGSFYEAGHLDGSVDMYEVVKSVILEMQKRKVDNRKDWQLTFRPDHGLTMLDDLKKPPLKTPGYTCIGRLRGLSEIHGLQIGISKTLGLK
jgi:mannonate dehydratase